MTVSESSIRGLRKDDVWNFENGYHWFSDPSRIYKLLSHYELYKMIVHLPGDVFELGVYKAASLVRFASFRNLLETDYSRRIVGFDAFGKFPRDGLSSGDANFVERFETAGGDGLSVEEIERILSEKGFRNIELVKGNVTDTLHDYLERKPETRISLLHLDMDVKEPTEFALDLLFERIVPDGLILLDDYNAVAGETDAVDEFVKSKRLKLEKLPFYNTPAFIRKSS